MNKDELIAAMREAMLGISKAKFAGWRKIAERQSDPYAVPRIDREVVKWVEKQEPQIQACAEAALTLMSREWVTSRTSWPPARRLVEIILNDGHRTFAELREDGFFHASKKRKYPFTAVKCWTFALPSPPKDK